MHSSSSLNPFWPSFPSVGSIPPLMETYSSFFQRPLYQPSVFSTTTQPYQHASFTDYNSRPTPMFNHSDHSSRDVVIPPSNNHVPVQHQPPPLSVPLPFFHTYPSMISPSTEHVDSFCRQDSFIRTSESSSWDTDTLGEEVMIIDDDSPSNVSPLIDHHNEESTRSYVERAHERLDRYQSIFSSSRSISPLSKSRSRSPPYRQVIIQSNDNRVKSSSFRSLRGKKRHRNRQQRVQNFIHEKYLLRTRQPSSTQSLKPQSIIRRSPSNSEHNDKKMAHLFDKYTSEKNEINIQNVWRPLPLADCQQLYKYALEKYQRNSISTH